MAVKLRVLHGTLRRRHGGSAGADVKVKGQRFVIGSGMDCNLRCPSSSISDYHCEILTEPDRLPTDPERLLIRDLGSESGTFVNGERLAKARLLHAGDLLRVGKLEFEVVIETQAAPPPPAPRVVDLVGDRISDMLVEADNEARAERLDDPAKRNFAIQSPAASTESDIAASGPKKKQVIPPRRNPPQKLPVAPRMVADSTVEAAEEVLKKYFEKPRK